MSKSAYLADLQRRLKKLEMQIQADRAQITGGAPKEKVTASGDLAFVEQQLAETKQKLARVEHEPEGLWEDIKAELDEELDHLEVAFERWVSRQ